MPRRSRVGRRPTAAACSRAWSKQAVKPEHVYAHAWQPGQVVFWDNRCLLHRGAGYDADRYRRYMRQTRVRGDGPTLAEAA